MSEHPPLRETIGFDQVNEQQTPTEAGLVQTLAVPLAEDKSTDGIPPPSTVSSTVEPEGPIPNDCMVTVGTSSAESFPEGGQPLELESSTSSLNLLVRLKEAETQRDMVIKEMKGSLEEISQLQQLSGEIEALKCQVNEDKEKQAEEKKPEEKKPQEKPQETHEVAQKESIEDRSETMHRYEYNDDASDHAHSADEDHEDPDYQPTAEKRKGKKSAAPRRKRVRNVREWIARQDELEAERKRKNGSDDGSSNKYVKLANGSRHRISDHDGAATFSSLRGLDATVVDQSLPEAQAIQATTLKQQWKQIKASIPTGCDLRRTDTQKKDLELAQQCFGHGMVKAYNGDWLMKGMRSALKSHQLTATAWMAQAEANTSRPDGGILADVMGLGKTVMTLACIVGNPPERKDIEMFTKATLVVVPSQSIARQWQQEISKHCEGSISNNVFMYTEHDGRSIRQIADHSSIVITTYKQISDQYPSKEVLAETRDACDGDDYMFRMKVRQKSKELFRVVWYRVVLDEAHAIKNPKGRYMRACCDLRRNFSWALSGTPLANKKFYSYFKFIDVSYSSDIQTFKSTYIEDENAAANLDTMVSSIMYRRTLQDSFLGRKIIDLPPSVKEDLWVPISTEESIINHIVDEHWKEIIDEIRKEAKALAKSEGQAGPNTESVAKSTTNGKPQSQGKVKEEEAEGGFMPPEVAIPKGSAKLREFRVLQMRCNKLRQCISHPFNLESMWREKLYLANIVEMKARLKDEGGKETILDQIQKPTNGGASDIAKYQTGLQKLKAMRHTSFGGLFNVDKLLGLIANEQQINETQCCICNKKGPPTNATRSKNCDHVFCKDCIWGEVIEAVNKKKDIVSFPSPKCRNEDCSAELEPSNYPIPTLSNKKEILQGNKYREPGTDCKGVKLPRSRAQNSCFRASAADLQIDLCPSSKITATMAVLLTWLDEAPKDKIIVFTQFVMTGKVLGRILELANIPFLYFFGDISQKQKDEALKEFNNNPAIKVILVSLKAGGQGLNLTVANRVINVDPWWNFTAEQQAFSRVVRLGQTKTSYYVKIMIRGSIDDRMDQIQRDKGVNIDRVLQDDGHVPEKLDEECLRMLFSPSPENESDKERKKKYTEEK